MASGRAFADVEWWEHRADRSYDEADGAGLLHPNGTQIVSFDRQFLAAATRELLDVHFQAAECPAWGGEHRFRLHDERPTGPADACSCECGAQPTHIDTKEAASA